MYYHVQGKDPGSRRQERSDNNGYTGKDLIFEAPKNQSGLRDI